MEGGDSEFANFTQLTLKTFLEARIENVSGNKTNLLLVLNDARKRIFFLTNSRSSGQPKNDTKTLFSHPPSPFSGTVIFATATVVAFVLLRNSRFKFLCYTQREATPTQKSSRK